MAHTAALNCRSATGRPSRVWKPPDVQPSPSGALLLWTYYSPKSEHLAAVAALDGSVTKTWAISEVALVAWVGEDQFAELAMDLRSDQWVLAKVRSHSAHETGRREVVLTAPLAGILSVVTTTADTITQLTADSVAVLQTVDWLPVLSLAHRRHFTVRQEATSLMWAASSGRGYRCLHDVARSLLARPRLWELCAPFCLASIQVSSFAESEWRSQTTAHGVRNGQTPRTSVRQRRCRTSVDSIRDRTCRITLTDAILLIGCSSRLFSSHRLFRDKSTLRLFTH